MQIDPAISLALAVEARKGVYALLLGSGVSRSAGVPTGWEVVLELIRRLAAVHNHDLSQEPDKWYRQEFGDVPNYASLIEALAPTPPERTSLLREYFEPTEEERREGLKVPTPAHKAIARLVAGGYFKVIITTNFDRLLEQALQSEGVSPTVVGTPDQIAGMMPLPHAGVVIVKVHGDYLDTRLRNTAAELTSYHPEMTALLDRILTEYGLIVCGWSGDWDTALADAIERNARFRFSTFWMHRSKLSDVAVRLIAHRRAIEIPIESADAAFGQLEAQVLALAEDRLAEPISPRVATVTVKRLLAEQKHRIQLEDYVIAELGRVKADLTLDNFPVGEPTPGADTYPVRVEQMSSLCSRLVPMIAAGAYWGGTELSELWKRCAETLATMEIRGGTVFDAWKRLYFLPANLATYAALIPAVLRSRYELVRILCVDARARYGPEDPGPLVAVLGSEMCFQNEAAQSLHKPLGNQRRWNTPGSDWMVEYLQSALASVVGSDRDLEDIFDEVEILIALIALEQERSFRIGRVGWRHKGQDSAYMRMHKSIMESGPDHPLLRVGLFNSDTHRLQECWENLRKVINRVDF